MADLDPRIRPLRPPAEPPAHDDDAATFDPLRYCIFTTIAVIAWIAGPAVATMVMAGLGLAAYGQAWRRGLRSSRCALGDVRLVMTYLAVAFAAGAFAVVRSLERWLS